jgi:hypothetical protein
MGILMNALTQATLEILAIFATVGTVIFRELNKVESAHNTHHSKENKPLRPFGDRPSKNFTKEESRPI